MNMKRQIKLVRNAILECLTSTGIPATITKLKRKVEKNLRENNESLDDLLAQQSFEDLVGILVRKGKLVQNADMFSLPCVEASQSAIKKEAHQTKRKNEEVDDETVDRKVKRKKSQKPGEDESLTVGMNNFPFIHQVIIITT